MQPRGQPNLLLPAASKTVPIREMAKLEHFAPGRAEMVEDAAARSLVWLLASSGSAASSAARWRGVICRTAWLQILPRRACSMSAVGEDGENKAPNRRAVSMTTSR